MGRPPARLALVAEAFANHPRGIIVPPGHPLAGMGLAFIALHTVGLELQTRNPAVLDVKGLPIVRTWYSLHPANKLLSPAAAAFQRFMVAEAPAHMESLFPGASKLPRS